MYTNLTILGLILCFFANCLITGDWWCTARGSPSETLTLLALQSKYHLIISKAHCLLIMRWATGYHALPFLALPQPCKLQPWKEKMKNQGHCMNALTPWKITPKCPRQQYKISSYIILTAIYMCVHRFLFVVQVHKYLYWWLLERGNSPMCLIWQWQTVLCGGTCGLTAHFRCAYQISQ